LPHDTNEKLSAAASKTHKTRTIYPPLLDCFCFSPETFRRDTKKITSRGERNREDSDKVPEKGDKVPLTQDENHRQFILSA
jgi:hypothetical protein